MVNGSRSFLVAPDGSKEGWLESATGDAMRSEFVAYLRSLAYEDGSTPLSWVELSYGGDDDEVQVYASDLEDSAKFRETHPDM